mgnify:CR=1 FL=1
MSLNPRFKKWRLYDSWTTPDPIRACHVCTHAQGLVTQHPTCHHPEALNHGAPTLCESMRKPAQACGPEAFLQHIKGS